MSRLESVLDGIAKASVCVVGDVLLDVFTRGHAERTCPDAPALVVHEQSVTYRASGAALAAQPLASLGARVHLVTVLGDDDAGRRAAELIRTDGTRLTLVSSGRITPTKQRITAVHPAASTGSAGAGSLLLRLDREQTGDVPPDVEDVLITAACESVAASDAVLISDYAKGVCTARLVRAVIDAAQAAGVPVVVDPKHPDPRRYTGATALTPNLFELAALTGRAVDDASQAELVRLARTEAGVEWVVATRDAGGALAAGPSGRRMELPAFAGEVCDVAGAGDVLAGVLVAALTCAPMREALLIASLAAGLSLRESAHKRVTTEQLLVAAQRHGVMDWFPDMEVQGT